MGAMNGRERVDHLAPIKRIGKSPGIMRLKHPITRADKVVGGCDIARHVKSEKFAQPPAIQNSRNITWEEFAVFAATFDLEPALAKG
jgi:hypothetical protein